MNPSLQIDSSSPSPLTWTVYRQDDNGNRFVVERHLSRDAATHLVAELEAHGHKQFYWAETDASD
jgi:hypothetical protein